jgi:pyruvate kinase
MSLSKLPIIQKKIIKKCRTKSKPVIIATQILESMINSSLPTRAEVNDVANAVYEQVDAVMLSGETAIGEYPIETIDMMNNIILNVEMEFEDYKIINETEDVKDKRYAIGEAVKTISRNLDIDSIVVMTESGSTAEVVSYFRPEANIYSLSPFLNVCNKMSLFWGVTSIKSEHYLSTDEMLISAEAILLEKKYMKKNQIFVMTAGIPVGISGSTNMLKIQKIS